MIRRIRKLLLLLATAAASLVFTSSALAAAPTLTAEGNTLHWTAVPSNTTHWRIEIMLEREKTGPAGPYYAGEPGGTLSYTPIIEPNETSGTVVGTYRVKEDEPVLATEWSNAVSITYPWPVPTHVVNAHPTGPTETEWAAKPAYAEAFGAPIGTNTGQDNTIWRTEKGNHTNSREKQVFRASEDSIGTEGLTEQCTRHSEAIEGKFYTCGEVKTSTGAGETATGYKLFKWHIAEGAIWAFETVIKYPPNKANEDYGFWSYAYNSGKEEEFDFTESWGYEPGNTLTSGYEKTENGTCWLPHTYAEGPCGRIHYSFDPSAGYHRYTTVIYPNNTFSQYIDGELNPKVNHISITATPWKDWMNLIDQYAMAGEGFPEGEHPSLTVKSIAVYQDKAHEGQQIENGGIAPGTTVK